MQLTSPAIITIRIALLFNSSRMVMMPTCLHFDEDIFSDLDLPEHKITWCSFTKCAFRETSTCYKPRINLLNATINWGGTILPLTCAVQCV